VGLKNKLFSKPIFRNIADTFGGRSAYSREDKTFVPYFQYRIGDYQSDYFLYFDKEPHRRLYTNEIFNKLNEYNGYDIIRYLEFHFENCTDKNDFLRFLSYEVSERMKLVVKNRRMKLQSAIDWVAEKQKEIQQTRQQEIEKEVQAILQNQSGSSHVSIEKELQVLSEKLSSYIENLVANAEKSMQEITRSFTTGNIQLNNRNHEDKLIQLLVLLNETKDTGTEQLFKKFSLSDIAAILRLHFDAFSDKKLNTVQKNVAEQQQAVYTTKSEKVKALAKALSDFFYEK